jgi:dTDP-glucose 4,6-dehydratase
MNLKKNKKNFLVLASNSFSGSHFVDYVLKKKNTVIGVSRSKEPNNVFLPYKSSKFIKNFKFIRLDINKNAINLKKIIKKYKITHIVNFAAQSMVGQSWEKPEDWYNTNTLGTIKFLNLIRDIKTIKKYIHISTPEVYGSTKKNLSENRNYHPSTPYAISRAACDMHLHSLFQNYKFPVVFTRASNVYGPGQQLYRIVPKAIMCLNLKQKLKLDGGGKSKRSFIYITDVAKATYKLCNKSINGDIYHISTNKLVSIKNLVETIFKMKRVASKKYLEVSSDRIGKDSLYSLSSKKIRKELKWSSKVNLKDGLMQTIKWVEKNIDILKNQPKKYVHKK